MTYDERLRHDSNICKMHAPYLWMRLVTAFGDEGAHAVWRDLGDSMYHRGHLAAQIKALHSPREPRRDDDHSDDNFGRGNLPPPYTPPKYRKQS